MMEHEAFDLACLQLHGAQVPAVVGSVDRFRVPDARDLGVGLLDAL